ncbi:hypothetical protein J6590_102253 [Homalodisca vitripennis]|nr:hypothetical protein J6590_102253 [Homalodisca vitripennis]
MDVIREDSDAHIIAGRTAGRNCRLRDDGRLQSWIETLQHHRPEPNSTCRRKRELAGMIQRSLTKVHKLTSRALPFPNLSHHSSGQPLSLSRGAVCYNHHHF